MIDKKNLKLNKNEKSVAPDGGWGWFVCLGSSLITRCLLRFFKLNNFILLLISWGDMRTLVTIIKHRLSLRSLDPSFGLIFNDLLMDLKVDSTRTSSVLSVFDACANFSGILVGPLLNKLSYRSVAVFGSVLSCTGLILTAFANSITHILITYSILRGIGTGLAVASAFVPLCTYFDKKRGQAVGFASAGTALAMMIIPQAAHYLLNLYGFRGTMLIFGAWSMHAIVGACLLRPLNVKDTKKSTINSTIKVQIDRKINEESINGESKSLLMTQIQRNNDQKLFYIDKYEIKNKQIDNKGWRDFFKSIAELFAIDLLKNYSYLNVIFGLSLFNVAESNFKLITPFFLRNSVGLSEGEVASCLSLTAFTDIVARIILPIIYDKLGFKKRRIFWMTVLFVGMGRSILAESSKGIWLFVILIINGFIRGAAIQNLLLSVSETCSLKCLPNAFGLYMVSKGIFSLGLSPIVGYIRDYSESYRVCLHSMNILILILFINWSIEFIFVAMRRNELKQMTSQCAH